MAKGKIGVLFSGGLDSAALIAFLLDAGYQVWPVYVRSGLRWERTEQKAAKEFLAAVERKQLHELTLATLYLENAYRDNWSQTGQTPGRKSDDRSVFLPARNLLLLTKALLSLVGDEVRTLAIATLKGNPFPDGRLGYFHRVERILSDGLMTPVRIVAPLRGFTKVEVIRRAKKFPLHLTMSCIAPRVGRHCGQCNKCEERRAAFAAAHVEDRTSYIGSGKRAKRFS